MMKPFFYCLYLLLIVVAANHFDQIRELQSNLLKYGHPIKQVLSKVNDKTQGIIVIGDSGSGKSTLINYLVGKQLKVNKAKYGNIYQYQNAETQPQIKIGNTVGRSETKVPACLLDQQGTIYIDTPGFKDTQGFTTNIVNGLLIKKLLNSIKNKKVVIVIEQSQIVGTRGFSLRENIQMMQNMFGPLIQNLVIVVSKAQEGYDYQSQIIDTLNQNKQANHFQLELIKKSKIVYFYRPTSKDFEQSSKRGFIDVGQKKDRRIIREVFNKIKYIDSNQIDFPFSGQDALLLTELVKNISHNTVENFRNVTLGLANEITELQGQKINSILESLSALFPENGTNCSESGQLKQSYACFKKTKENSKVIIVFEKFLQSIRQTFNSTINKNLIEVQRKINKIYTNFTLLENLLIGTKILSGGKTTPIRFDIQQQLYEIIHQIEKQIRHNYEKKISKNSSTLSQKKIMLKLQGTFLLYVIQIKQLYLVKLTSMGIVGLIL